MYLLDTTVWIHLLRTNSPAIRRRLSLHSKRRIGLSIITLCELQYGIERHAIRHPHLREREQDLLLALVAPFDGFPLDVNVVETYGKVRTTMEDLGTSMGALDTFIAAQAVNLGATLVTSKFQRVPGLRVEDWR